MVLCGAVFCGASNGAGFPDRAAVLRAREAVGRADHVGVAAGKDVCVDHGRLHALVAQELLHRPDVVAVLEEVGGVAMAERMA